MSKFFSEPRLSKGKKEIELDLSICANATKADLKNATGVDTEQFFKKGWFSKLKIRNW